MPTDARDAVGDADLVITGEGSRALTDVEPDLERCLQEAGSLLTSLARGLAETSPLLRRDSA